MRVPLQSASISIKRRRRCPNYKEKSSQPRDFVAERNMGVRAERCGAPVVASLRKMYGTKMHRKKSPEQPQGLLQFRSGAVAKRLSQRDRLRSPVKSFLFVWVKNDRARTLSCPTGQNHGTESSGLQEPAGLIVNKSGLREVSCLSAADYPCACLHAAAAPLCACRHGAAYRSSVRFHVCVCLP